MKLIVTTPTDNEAATIGDVIAEVLVVDDGTAETADGWEANNARGGERARRKAHVA